MGEKRTKVEGLPIRGTRRQYPPAPRDTGPFLIALALVTLSGVVTNVVCVVRGDNSSNDLAAGLWYAMVISGLLWFFARRGHRWPKWFLLAVIVVGVGGDLAALDLTSLLIVFDAAALVILLRGWAEIEGGERRVTR